MHGPNVPVGSISGLSLTRQMNLLKNNTAVCRNESRLRAGRQLLAKLLQGSDDVAPAQCEAALQLTEEQYWGGLQVCPCTCGHSRHQHCRDHARIS